ncbi:Vacuolar ATPase assembly integral membrane protein Vma21, partial [Dillenia turbinata]
EDDIARGAEEVLYCILVHVDGSYCYFVCLQPSMGSWSGSCLVVGDGVGFGPNINRPFLTGFTELSSYHVTLLSGFLAVISVNMVIAFYIWMAMQEPSDKHEPDPKFLAEAEASINQCVPSEAAESREKQE